MLIWAFRNLGNFKNYQKIKAVSVHVLSVDLLVLFGSWVS